MEQELLQRKSSLKLRPWHTNYLVSSSLQSDLTHECNQLHGILLDLGCGNSPYRPLLKNISGYIPYDSDVIRSNPQVVGIAQHLPFQSETFDSVMSTQVLEHVSEPWSMLEEIARVLRSGGQLLLSAPQAWRLHEEPFDYYRYTKYGLEYLAQKAGLQITHISSQGGVWLLIGQTVNNTIWRNPPLKYSFHWFVLMVCTVIINTICVLLNHFWKDEGDTLNYVVMAVKK